MTKDQIGIAIAGVGALAAVVFYLRQSASASSAQSAGSGTMYPLFQSAALPADTSAGASSGSLSTGTSGADLSAAYAALQNVTTTQAAQSVNNNSASLGEAIFAQIAAAQPNASSMHGDFSITAGTTAFNWQSVPSQSPLAPVPLPPSAPPVTNPAPVNVTVNLQMPMQERQWPVNSGDYQYFSGGG